MNHLKWRGRILLVVIAASTTLSHRSGGNVAEQDPTLEKIEVVRTQIEQEITVKSLNEEEANGLRAKLTFIQNLLAHNHPEEGVAHHVGAFAVSAKTPGLRKAWEDLQMAVGKRRELRMKKDEKDTEALLQKARGILLEAKKPSELVPIINEMQKFSIAIWQRSPADNQALQSRINEATNALRNWQGFLSAEASGRLGSMKSQFDSIRTQLEDAFPGIPAGYLENRMKAGIQQMTQSAEEAIQLAEHDLTSSKTPEDVQTILDTIDVAYQRISQTGDEFITLKNKLQRARRTSNVWGQILKDESQDNLPNALSQLQDLENNRNLDYMSLPQLVITNKRKELLESAVKKAETTLNVAARDFPSATSKDNVDFIIFKLDAYSRCLKNTGSDFSPIKQRVETAQHVGNLWSNMVAAQARGDYQTALSHLKQITAINNEVHFLPPEAVAERVKQVELLLGKMNSDETSFSLIRNDEMRKLMAAEIAKIGEASDLLKLIELIRKKQETALPDAREDLANLRSDLTSLAAIWSAMNQGRPIQEFGPSQYGLHPWSKDLDTLRAKLLRRGLAAQLNAPEILKAPLDTEAPDVAIMKLATEESKRDHWKRVFDLLNNYTQTRQFRAGSQTVQEIGGIADYLAGQNFEKAEQWREAISAYQNVLRRVGDLLPIDQATVRLRILKKQHPEVFEINSQAKP